MRIFEKNGKNVNLVGKCEFGGKYVNLGKCEFVENVNFRKIM